MNVKKSLQAKLVYLSNIFFVQTFGYEILNTKKEAMFKDIPCAVNKRKLVENSKEIIYLLRFNGTT